MDASVISSNLGLVLDAISDGVYVTSEDREIVYWNAGAERITGYSAGEVVGTHCYDNILVHTDMRGRRLCFSGCPLHDCIRTGRPGSVNEAFLKRKDGRRVAVYMKTATFVSDGKTYGVEVFGELAGVAGQQLAAEMQRLSEMSLTDPLTGLFNRRYLDAALEQQFEMFRRIGRRYGVLHLDVDHFKSMNDTLGHAGGDDALRFVAGVLSSNARRMDVTARYGGDEFVILCAVADGEELEAYASRLVTLVRTSRFEPAEASGLPLTISVGATLVGDSDPDARAALERADAAMYEAKRAGRDGLALDVPR